MLNVCFKEMPQIFFWCCLHAFSTSVVRFNKLERSTESKVQKHTVFFMFRSLIKSVSLMTAVLRCAIPTFSGVAVASRAGAQVLCFYLQDFFSKSEG